MDLNFPTGYRKTIGLHGLKLERNLRNRQLSMLNASPLGSSTTCENRVSHHPRFSCNPLSTTGLDFTP